MTISHHRRCNCVSLLIVSSVAFGVACTREPKPDREALERSLRSVDSALTAAVLAEDADRTAEFYDENAEMLPVAEPVVVGRDAIRREWSEIFGIPGYSSQVQLTRADVSADGTLGYTRGTYVATMLGTDGKPTTEVGKWVTVWRRQNDGAWRIVQDIYNTDAPPPDHQESTHGSEGASNRPRQP